MRAEPGPIDAAFVARWSGEYPLNQTERHLLDVIGPGVAERGYFRRDDLIAVGRWKSARSLSRLNANPDGDIEDITRAALASPDRLKHRLLHLLHGVRTPMASALLTIWAPARFTVIDFRAIETLQACGELTDPDPLYQPYVAVCRTISDRVGTDLRTLDRALWAWSKQRGGSSEPTDDGAADTVALVATIED
ncbi:MAG: hypothetical protein L0H64_08255 [Pseudonocardia sp.]|nr:hypothetical protein [Pseudonocardia sp.]